MPQCACGADDWKCIAEVTEGKAECKYECKNCGHKRNPTHGEIDLFRQ